MWSRIICRIWLTPTSSSTSASPTIRRLHAFSSTGCLNTSRRGSTELNNYPASLAMHGVPQLKLIAPGDPVMPIANRLLGGFVYSHAIQLRQRHRQTPPLPLHINKLL